MRRGYAVVIGVVVIFTMVGCTAQPRHLAESDSPRSAVPARDGPSSELSSSELPSTATPSTTASRVGTPTATADNAQSPTYPTVGALFQAGQNGAQACTGSVVASATANTVLTAAHCIHGSGVGMAFIPAYRRGVAPEGVWRVTGAYVSTSWQHDQDPQYDYAVLTVSPRHVGGHVVNLTSVTGSERLGTSPSLGTLVTVVGYNHGTNVAPVSCRAPVYLVEGFPTIDCHGFADGTSGSPWLTKEGGGLIVRGVIGGREAGGCHEYRSHTSFFTADVAGLIRRAEQGEPPDSVQPAGPVGC